MPASEAIKAPPALRAKLEKLGLSRAIDLVLHLPLRYEDETRIVTISSALSCGPVQLEVAVSEVSVQYRPRR